MRVVPSKPGTTLDIQQGAAGGPRRGLGPGRRLAAVGLTALAADLTTKEAKALGIREEVSSFTTDMGASSANRIWNVHLLGDYLDGTIVEAGETFSYNKEIGPRTVERGFREGQMIWGGVLIPSIGGGVCQTATTIFNAAFEAGLPILSRSNHAFYISHYPMGRDATVSWGGPEFEFRNDLKNAILIKVSYTDVDVHGHVLRDEAGPQGRVQDERAHELHPAGAPVRGRPRRASELGAPHGRQAAPAST